VFCQLELLRQCFPPSVRRILEELPDSLDETYERILKEIRKPNQGHAHRLLQCLVVAVRPLRVEELAEVLAFDFNTGGMPKLNPGWRWEDQEEAVTSACSSLVTIVKDGDSRVVQFSLFSVKEFLTADRLAEPIRDVSSYHIRLEAAHTVLAQACLGVLLRLDDRVDRDNIENFPLARYGAQYWPTHARVGNVSSHIKDGMERLFDADKPHFATWLWICNEDQWGDFRFMSTMRPEEPEEVPLYHAARLGFRDMAERLIIEHPEHVNARGGAHETPMHTAANAGHANILSLLIQHGADVNGRDRNGITPLFLASRNASLEAGQFLLNHGADIHARDEYNDTALIHAVMINNIEFTRMLLKRGAAINAPCADDMTPLHFMARGGRTELVRLLLEHGANANARDRFGDTPSQLASRYGLPEIVELLSEYGAEPVTVYDYGSEFLYDYVEEASLLSTL
jgi:Ankyrin repeats (3 copies)/Ankyrin repeat